MQNWYDPAKETESQKCIKPDKVMACLRASLSPVARSIYKYSLGLTEENLKNPHLVLAALTEFYGASIGVSGDWQKFLCLMQEESESIALWETRICNQGAQCEYENFAEPMLSRSIPSWPWSKISVDLFQLDGKHYLVMVDHYSDYFELDSLRSTTASAVIQVMKRNFARHGIPDVCINSTATSIRVSPRITASTL